MNGISVLLTMLFPDTSQLVLTFYSTFKGVATCSVHTLKPYKTRPVDTVPFAQTTTLQFSWICVTRKRFTVPGALSLAQNNIT